MATDGNEIKQKLSTKYYCEYCDYGTCRKSNIDAHFMSTRHLKSTNGHTNGNILKQIKQNESTEIKKYTCEICKKGYKDRTGLWKHKTKGACIKTPDEIVETTASAKPVNMDISPELIQLITELVKGQSGLQESIIELCKNGTHNTTNNNTTTTTNTNSHNKAFNLNFFLNETCKDAMNIMDFVESIQFQLSDLEKMGEIGYVEGISNIIVKNLNALDVSQRPVHCTDKKRETIYIKDQDKWEKDDEQKKIRKVIKKVANKNAMLIQQFKEKHPDYNKYHSKYSTQYHKLIIESFGGSGNNDLEKEDKIIRNISKNITVDK